MQIEFKEKNSEDYFREGINVQVQYQVLQKKPEGKQAEGDGEKKPAEEKKKTK